MAIIASMQFEVIRRSVKMTDRHDARAIAFFLSKDMLPEVRSKREVQSRLYSLISLRDQLAKQRVSLLNRIPALFVRNGIRKKEKLTSKKGFDRAVALREWHEYERLEIDIASKQLEGLLEACKRLEKKITSVAQTLQGYEQLISIEGVGSLSVAVFPCSNDDVERFPEPGNPAAWFGITPRVSQSNDSQRVGRITKRGDKLARTALVQCALVALRYSPFLKAFHEKIEARRGSG